MSPWVSVPPLSDAAAAALIAASATVDTKIAAAQVVVDGKLAAEDVAESAVYGMHGGQSAQVPMSALAVKRMLIQKSPPAQVRWVCSGSSVALMKYYEYFTTLQRALGGYSGSLGVSGGANAGSAQSSLGISTNSGAGTVTDNTTDYTAWWSGQTITFGAGGSRVYGEGGVAFVCDHVEVYYLGGAGVLGVQVDAGAVVNVDTSLVAAGTLGIYTATPARGSHTVTLSTVSGTPKVTGTPVALWDGTASGLLSGAVNQGGLLLSSATTAAWTNYTTWLAHILPDVITWEMKAGQWDQTTLNRMLDAIKAGAPKADVLLIGSTPDSGSDTAQLAANLVIQSTAKTYQAGGLNALYWDGFTPLGSWARVNALGIGGDGVHLAWQAQQFLASLMLRDLGILDAIAGTSSFDVSAGTVVASDRIKLGPVSAPTLDIESDTRFGLDVGLTVKRNMIIYAADGVTILARYVGSSGQSQVAPTNLQIGDGNARFVGSASSITVLMPTGAAGADFLANRHLPQFKAGATIAAAGDYNIDASLGEIFSYTLAASGVNFTISNLAWGQKFQLHIMQDATGGRTYGFHGGYFRAGSAGFPAAGATANLTDIWSFVGFNSTGRALLTNPPTIGVTA